MNRTTLLQERRMQTFHDVLGHWQARRLSAPELLGMRRSFRRYRQRYRGGAGRPVRPQARQGVAACRSGGVGARRYRGDGQALPRPSARSPRLRLGYTWNHPAARGPGPQGAQARRPPSPASEALRRHGSIRTARVMSGWRQAPPISAWTTRAPTRPSWSRRRAPRPPSARSSRCSPPRACPGLYTDRGSPHPRGRRQSPTQVGRALHQLSEHIAAYSPQARGRSERAFGTLQNRLARPQTASSKRATCPTTTGASQQSPSSKPAPSCHRLHPTMSTSVLCMHTKRARTPCATTGPANPRQPGQAVKATVRVPSIQRHGCLGYQATEPIDTPKRQAASSTHGQVLRA